MFLFQLPAIVQPHSQKDIQRNTHVFYPFVTGLNNKMAEQTINQTIMANLNQLLKERDFYEPSLVELQAWFEVKTNQRGVLSIALFVYSYTGGAHGMTTIKTLTFDTAKGKLFTLNELFKPNSNYQEVLLNLIKVQVKTRNIPVISEPISFPGNNNYYIADKSLVLFYQLYDLAPYYYGITYFPINIYDIQSLIDENGPLGKMMGSY